MRLMSTASRARDQDGFHHKLITKRELFGNARELLREIDPVSFRMGMCSLTQCGARVPANNSPQAGMLSES